MTDSKKLSQERYNKFAQGYVTSKNHAKGWELDRLVELAQPQAEWVMLDVATGGGHTALKFAPHVAHATASDLTPNMLKAAEENIRGKGITNVDFKQADAEDLPFDDSSFDLVTCRVAPHHFPNVPKFISEVYRVLKAGGVFIMQDHVVPEDEESARFIDHFERLRDPSHHFVYNEKQWVSMMEDVGFTVEHTETFGKKHEFVKWCYRQRCTLETMDELQDLLRDAPPVAAQWMRAENIGTPETTFDNNHIIIHAVK